MLNVISFSDYYPYKFSFTNEFIEFIYFCCRFSSGAHRECACLFFYIHVVNKLFWKGKLTENFLLFVKLNFRWKKNRKWKTNKIVSKQLRCIRFFRLSHSYNFYQNWWLALISFLHYHTNNSYIQIIKRIHTYTLTHSH